MLMLKWAYSNPSQTRGSKLAKFSNSRFLLFSSWKPPNWLFTSKMGPLTRGFQIRGALKPYPLKSRVWRDYCTNLNLWIFVPWIMLILGTRSKAWVLVDMQNKHFNLVVYLMQLLFGKALWAWFGAIYQLGAEYCISILKHLRDVVKFLKGRRLFFSSMRSPTIREPTCDF